MKSRRQFLKWAGAGVLAPATVGAGWGLMQPTKSVSLEAGDITLDLAGTLIKTWGYNGRVPGPEIRVTEGDRLRVSLRNTLKDQTFVHWHGISLVNSMDGTHLTQPAIEPGSEFEYDFRVPEAGTHWYHPHSGDQADSGLYGPLIVEPRHEDLSYDREYVLVLDDWSHGVPRATEAKDAATSASERKVGFGRYNPDSTEWQDLQPTMSFGGRAYPFLLVNGKPSADPAVFDVRAGERIRLRIINSAADTAFRFAVDGHNFTITHADGMPVDPVTVDTLRIGMAERYDVLLTANSPGISQIALLPEGKKGLGRALLRYLDAPGSAVPPADFHPPQFEMRMLTYSDLICRFPEKVQAGRNPDRTFNIVLDQTSMLIEGKDKKTPIIVAEGEVIRFNLKNISNKWHPMHLHGHHFHLNTSGRPLKDTVIVPSGEESVSIDWHADNPGKWMTHCHNHYHHKDGMMRVICYESHVADYFGMPPGSDISDLCW